MINQILQAIWYILPSYVANVVPALVKKINILNYPVDFGGNFKNKRIFGPHKTFRGLFLGILFSGITSIIQLRGFRVGLIIGTGTLFGDLVGSFVKRRMGFEAGKKNLFIDEVPGSFFGISFAYIFGVLTLDIYQVLFLLILGIPLHILANKLWYRLKLKEVPW